MKASAFWKSGQKALLTTALASAVGCAHQRPGYVKYEAPEPPPPPTDVEIPDWVESNQPNDGKVCGVGIAGRAFFKESEAPKTLARERAVHNLAGIVESFVLEAQIVKSSAESQNIEFERAVTVDESLVEQVNAAATSDFWLDAQGAGPMREKDFTYARACIDASMASEKVGIDAKSIEKKIDAVEGFSGGVPKWVTQVGATKGTRICAVGFSQPTFYPEMTLRNVVDDIRGQLLDKTKTLVMDAFEDTLACKDATCRQFIDDTLAATTEAISKNVVITHLWYDHRGIGPNRSKRTGYGFGCVFPIRAMNLASKVALAEHPEISTEQVKEAAEKLFDELEQMEERGPVRPRKSEPAEDVGAPTNPEEEMPQETTEANPSEV